MGWFDWLFRGGSSRIDEMPPEWQEIIERRVPHWRHLDDADKARLDEIAMSLIGSKRWEAANGFDVTDEMVVTISAQAALLAIGLPDGVYRRVRTILIHPTTMQLSGEHSYGGGVVSSEERAVLGLAAGDGMVAIAWNAVLDDARHLEIGHNVVLHEFAHQLDLLDGAADGTPPIATREELQRWTDVTTTVFHQVAHGQGGSSLSPYAGVSLTEFFAVATEAFFSAPERLRHQHRDLYDVLAAFYRQDPAERVARR